MKILIALTLALTLTACGTDDLVKMKMSDTGQVLCPVSGYSLVPMPGAVLINGGYYVPCAKENQL